MCLANTPNFLCLKVVVLFITIFCALSFLFLDTSAFKAILINALVITLLEYNTVICMRFFEVINIVLLLLLPP